MKHLGTIACLPILALASCAKVEPPTPVPLSQRLNQNYGYKQDKDGNWVPKTQKKSSFETERNSPYFKGDVAKEKFDTTPYDKKTWSGTKDFEHKDFATTSESSAERERSKFNKQSAHGMDASYDVSKPYATSEYATSNARENDGKEIEKPSDAETDVRRRVFPKPKIVDYEQQREMTIEQSKNLLGR